MTPANLAEIEESLKGITQGEWRLCGGYSIAYTAIHTEQGYVVWGFAHSDIKEYEQSIKCPDADQQRANAHFIANAPAYVATLVEAVKAKDKAIKRVLKYLRNPDDQDAEMIERILDRALAENIIENERKGE